jgi:NitT/TauT family transport system permease protein
MSMSTSTSDAAARKTRDAPPPSPAVREAKRRRQQRALRINGGRILLLVVLIAVWQLASGSLLSPLVFSSPLAVLRQLLQWIGDGTLWFHTAITLQETMLGLLFGIVAGIIAGFLLGPQQVLSKILDPFIIALYSIPKVALAPLFIVWFGIGLQMKVILAAVTVFFLVFFNTLAGVRNVDLDLVDAVHLMGGGRRDIMFKVIIPSATGWVLTGLRIAIPYALIGAIIAELVASNRGIGYLIDSSAAQFNTAGVFAALVVLTIIAAILNAIVGVIDRKTSRWKAVTGSGGTLVP